jgi:DNA-binding NtrC family response regulator
MINDAERRVAQGRILVVDDEQTIREIIISMLVKAGYECREAATGLEALALLHSGEKFDLMITDLLMPGLDGADLLDRTRLEYPDMHVVIASPIRDISVVIETFRHGACDYLPIFFDYEQLISVVTRVFEDHKRRREHQAYVSKLESQIAELTERLRVANT